MTTQKQTIRKPKVLAQYTPRKGADMKWLRDLLRNIILRPWVKSLRKQGTSIRLRCSSAVKHLDKSPAQYTLQLNFEVLDKAEKQ